MSFKDLDPILKPTYNSLKEDIVKNFYVPVLKEARRYDRISGYFDSSSLAIAAKGMGDFILNGGKMRLICGAKLYPHDLEMIKNASDAKDIISDRFLEDLDNIEDELINNHIKVLGWMIKNDILEIKVGFNKKDGKYIGGGILHSKSGIFWDNEESDLDDDLDHCIVFNGSNNETAAGWTSNFESFDVFRGPIFRGHMIEYINDFPKIWNGEYEYLEVMDIPDADKQALIDKSPNDIQELKRIIKKYYTRKKDDRVLFKHQSEAIDNWFKNNKQGIFEMATGTGKTFTAINCLEKLSEEEKDLITVIACPYAHLVEQWHDEIKKFDVDKIYIIYGLGNQNWKKDLSRLVKRINKKQIKKAVILTTHKTFAKDFFKDKISKINSNILLIADEMHHLAAEQYSTGLFEVNYKYKLGLSATPEKFMDEEATVEIQDYFGGIVYTFDLADAINNENPITHLSYLTPYDYIPEKINLTAEELTEYKDLTRKIGAFSYRKLSSEEQEVLNSLLRKRKYILNNAEEKYDKLREILRRYEELDHLIIFCSPQQIKKVLKILKEEGVTPRHRFTSKEKTRKDKKLGGLSQRQDLLDKFDKGQYKALVAMKCLNEGVDVPSADKVIIMSSTTNPIEYVQRRGRVLRRYPGKELAYIYDMVIVPDDSDSSTDSIIRKEMERLEEFIIIANNRDECNDKLNEWGVLS